MGSSTKKLLALVKWIGSEDDKKYTPGIDVNHIKNFDYEKFINDEEDPDKIYVIEWHDSVKEPPGGWRCYSAQVIAVSDSLVKLNKKLKTIDGIQSPKRLSYEIIPEGESSKNGMHANEETKNDDDTEVVLSDEDTDKSPTAKRKKLLEETDSPANNGIQKDELSQNNGKQGVIEPEIAIIEDIGVKPGTSQFVTHKDLEQAIAAALKSALSALPSVSSMAPTASNMCKKKHQRMKELGEPGSDVFITPAQWAAAEACTTFTAMTTSLLISVFPHDELLKSNYKGGAPKNAKDKSVVHTGLDKDKLQAIKETVKQRFKKEFSETEFGRCINVKCNKLRSLKNTLKKPSEEKNEKKDA